jgi:hypothetical protein
VNIPYKPKGGFQKRTARGISKLSEPKDLAVLARILRATTADPGCPARRGWAGLRNLPKFRLERPPWLADFALWVNACEEALGWSRGRLWRPPRPLCHAHDLALEASALYVPLVELAREGFTGTVAKLHARLDAMVSDTMRRSGALAQGAQRSVTRSGAWPPISPPREWSFSSAATTCRPEGRRVVSVVDAAQIRKTPSVAVSSRQ